ncbi:UDP-N-acetyl-D-mannosamine dehydrogenase [Defluviimonas sp. 20V17]|uniref:UDP-N-acetyl-D-mannosamine dehydrogenase n=1 Tax=Allgaiera indica TaxID=765699 RepID=A0AAN4UU02_9RHOB|nr:UDP-N-acetyl-D-mannosamine dehydrogenase [Allgaiera indica]KDB05070.1 UDP-N-acetyl-D-mannosamine dehydrogenase [Defluviimonas sp. 20V17]GHE04520.1 UDP-N-acetyl-D-mannosamine dehydrogenase [Allgaiera indica]SDX57171.1 UDP-N-acetyl-D-mannosaminuronic acid dehydrogenase [Allgaiera indica]
MSDHAFQRVSVIGLGYIGLPTAAMLASRKLEVVGVDVNQRAVDTINCGEVHIVEPDLDIIVRAAVSGGYLRATTKPEPAEAFLIAVPTPFKGHNHDPDLSYVEAAARNIAPVLKSGDLVILESTSPVGATEAMADWLAAARPDLSFPQTKGEESDIRIAHCPERVLPGKVMQELIINDRVIGGMTAACAARAVQLYETFVTGKCVVASSPRVAEMAKLTENSFRDVNIAFANELSLICHRFAIDVWELISLANRHPRVNILQPGPGVGGHCIAVDPWFIVSSAPDDAKLIRTAREVNDGKPGWVLDRIDEAIAAFLQRHPERSVNDVRVACYGLAFKPDIDDLRESPAMKITKAMSQRHKGPLLVVEPHIEELPAGLCNARLVTYDDAVETADVHAILVAHSAFRSRSVASDYVVDTIGAQ